MADSDVDLERLPERIFRLSFMLTGSREAAEEVAQETLLRALEKASQFRGDGDRFSWACSIAINLCRARRRAEFRRPKAVDPRALNGSAPKSPLRGPISNAILLESYARAAAALRKLAAPMRVAFVLHFIEDLAYQDVARITGVSEGAARLRVHRAKQILQTDLASFFEPEVRRRMARGPASPAR